MFDDHTDAAFDMARERLLIDGGSVWVCRGCGVSFEIRSVTQYDPNDAEVRCRGCGEIDWRMV